MIGSVESPSLLFPKVHLSLNKLLTVMGLFTEVEEKVIKSSPSANRRVNATCEGRLAGDFLLLLFSGTLIHCKRD